MADDPTNQNSNGEQNGAQGAQGAAQHQRQQPSDPNPSKETFSRDYVHELREENKSWRLKAQEAERAAREAQEAAERSKKEAEDQANQAKSQAEQRIIRAELKAAATKAGMIDLDGLKLADLSDVKLSDDGNVEGADELMAKMKESKPYLFSEGVNSSSSRHGAPKKEPPKAKKATEMTDEEYREARARAARGELSS